MIIKLAKTAGFCFGVNRAIDIINDLLNNNKKVYTLGPIIHNQHVVNDLEKRGAKIVENLSDLPSDATLVIRTHGVPKNIMDQVRSSNINFCDATCPFVKKIHKIVYENSGPDSVILIAGDINHPEVRGIRGYCRGESYVFNSLEDLDVLAKNNENLSKKDIFLVAQTTFDSKEWEKCVKKVKMLYTKAIVFDTICNATQERQLEARDLSSNSDAMIVIGDRHSSNTKKLQTVCEENCKTFLVETADELKNINFSGFDSVGVTAGASTPAGTIKEVLKTMSEEKENLELENATVEESVKEDSENEKINMEEAVSESEASVEEAPEKSFEEMSFSEALEESLKNMNSDQKVLGTVVGMSPTEIQVDIGRKHAGFVPFEEYSDDPKADPAKEVKIGDTMNLIIMKTNDAEGTVMLSKKRYDAIQSWYDVADAAGKDQIFEGVVTDVVRGGVIANTNGVKVFIPASLATANKNDPLEDLLKKDVKFRILEVNKQRRRAVGSIRSVLKDERKEQREAFWSQVAVNQTYVGKVKSMTNYGAFIDLGGVDGMVHISELSWKRIKHPSDVLKIGDNVEVYVKAIDEENRKISLGYKKIEDDPWQILKRDFPVGSVIDTKIVGLTAFGAFAKVTDDIDGLIHISQITDHRIDKPQDVLKVGDEVKVKITDIDFDKRRVSLSIRALMEPAENNEEEAEAVPEETANEETVEEVKVDETPVPEKIVEEQAEEATDEVAKEENATTEE